MLQGVLRRTPGVAAGAHAGADLSLVGKFDGVADQVISTWPILSGCSAMRVSYPPISACGRLGDRPRQSAHFALALWPTFRDGACLLSSAGVAKGRVNEKTLPPSGALRTSSFPPICSISSLLIASPSPAPHPSWHPKQESVGSNGTRAYSTSCKPLVFPWLPGPDSNQRQGG
jgi:hypothetical protein